MPRQKRQRKAYTNEERKVQVLGALAIAMQSGFDELTTNDIAHKLLMTASTHLRTILADMVVEGAICMRKESDPGIAGFRRMYSLPTGTTIRDVSKKAQGYVHGRKVETKDERDSRLMLAITRAHGQKELFN